MHSLMQVYQANQVLDSVFFYAVCTEHGYIKLGISRRPYHRLAEINGGSPSRVKGAMWSWVGDFSSGRELEFEMRRVWKGRRTRGEWFSFDYDDPSDKRVFHDDLNAAFEKICGRKAEWARFDPKRIAEILAEIGKEAYESKKKRRRFP